MQPSLEPPAWNEANSETFIDYGRYFVPDREIQIATMAALIPATDVPFGVLELCCGEGLLAEAVLDRHPAAHLTAYDGSPEMLRRAGERLRRFGDRARTLSFDLADSGWRQGHNPVRAVLSSLAIHHLDGPGKQQLFRDMARLIAPGGALIIADVIAPAHPLGWDVAADAWDEAVRQRGLALDGNTEALALFARERWNLYRYFDPADIDHPSSLFDQLRWLADAGFTGVDVFWMNAGHAIYGGFLP